MASRKAILFSYLDRYASMLVSFVASMIIARLLTPAEVGVFSITMVLIGFLGPLRDLGASQYLIKEPEVTREKIQSVWALQLALGILLSLIIAFSAGVVSKFYAEPGIENIMHVLAISALALPFGALTTAWLTRELRFAALALIRVSSTFAGAAVSIVYASAGYGPISLAYGALAATVSSAVLSVLFRPKAFPWLPALTEIRSILRFGLNMTGAVFMDIAYNGIPESVLGKLQGMTSAGYLSRGSGIVSLLMRLVTDGIAAPLLSIFRKKLSENEDISCTFLKLVSLITVIGWSTLSFLALYTESIIGILYGPQWGESVGITKILCAVIAVSLPGIFFPSLLVAAGRVRVLFHTNLVAVVLQIVLCTIGAHYGLTQMGLAMLVVSVLVTAIRLWIIRTVCPFLWSLLFHQLYRSALVVLGACTIPAVIAWEIPMQGTLEDLRVLVTGGLCFAVGLTITARLFRHAIWDEICKIVVAVRRNF